MRAFINSVQMRCDGLIAHSDDLPTYKFSAFCLHIVKRLACAAGILLMLFSFHHFESAKLAILFGFELVQVIGQYGSMLTFPQSARQIRV